MAPQVRGPIFCPQCPHPRAGIALGFLTPGEVWDEAGGGEEEIRPGLSGLQEAHKQKPA